MPKSFDQLNVLNLMWSGDAAAAGVHIVHRQIANAVADAGATIANRFLLAGNNSWFADADSYGFNKRALKGKRWRALGKWRAECRLRNELAEQAYDAVVCDGLGTLDILWRSLLASPQRLHLVVIHGEVSAKAHLRRRLRGYRGNNLRFVAISPSTQAHFIGEHPEVDAAQVICIENGLDESVLAAELLERDVARQELGLQEGQRIVGTISRLSKEKDIATQIRALARVADDSSLHWVIVGEGDQRALIESAIAQCGVADRVTLIGYRERAFRYLKAFDVVVASSIKEGFGISLLESVAAGVPVICSEIPSFQHILADAGCYFAVGDDEGLAVQVADALEQPQRLLAMAERQRASAFPRFSAERVARDYRSALESGVAHLSS